MPLQFYRFVTGFEKRKLILHPHLLPQLAPALPASGPHLAHSYIYWRRYAARKSAVAYLCQRMLPKPKQPHLTTCSDTQTHKAMPYICASNPSRSGESMFGSGVSTKITKPECDLNGITSRRPVYNRGFYKLNLSLFTFTQSVQKMSSK